MVAASGAASSSAIRSAAIRPSVPLHARSPASAAAAARRPAAKADRLSGARSKASTGSSDGRIAAHGGSAFFSAKWRSSPARPAGGRGPRKARSSARALVSQAARSPPSPPTSGCLTNASIATGAMASAVAVAMASNKVPAGAWLSGLPALSSAAMPQRPSNADTRAASTRSGVTKAAVWPEVSSAWRSAIAMAMASLAGSASSTARIPVRRRSGGGRRLHLSLKSAAVMALAMARPRTAGEAARPPPRHRPTSPRATSIRSSRNLR